MEKDSVPTEFTTAELREAIGGLLIVLGSTLPADASRYVASQLRDFAQHCGRGGKTNVEMLATGFAKALDEGASVPKTSRH